MTSAQSPYRARARRRIVNAVTRRSKDISGQRSAKPHRVVVDATNTLLCEVLSQTIELEVLGEAPGGGSESTSTYGRASRSTPSPDMRAFRPVANRTYARHRARDRRHAWTLIAYLPGDEAQSEGEAKRCFDALVRDAGRGADAGAPHVAALVDCYDDASGRGTRLFSTEGPHGRDLGSIDSGSAQVFTDFVIEALQTCPSRHVAFVLGGRPRANRSLTLCRDASENSSLTLTQIAQCLRAALDALGRDRLSILVLPDPRLLSIEVAYELRDVVHVMLTPGPSGQLDVAAVRAVLAALEAGHRGPTGRERQMYARERGNQPYRDMKVSWERAVARATGRALRRSGLITVDLQHVEGLCRRLDWVCQIVLRNIYHRVVWDALERGFGDMTGPVGYVLLRAAEGLELLAEHDPMLAILDESLRGAAEKLMRLEYAELFDTLDKIGQACGGTDTESHQEFEQLVRAFLVASRVPRRESAEQVGQRRAALVEHVDRLLSTPAVPRALMDHLRELNTESVSHGPQLDTRQDPSPDYLSLSFHRDVRLHALLTAWRILAPLRDTDAAGSLWRLISVALTHSSTTRGAQGGGLHGVDQNLGQFFADYGDPPMMTLSVEEAVAPSDRPRPALSRLYDLRLNSSESASLLLSHQSTVDIDAVDDSLRKLDALLARGYADDETWCYIESLGSSLAEDVINAFHERIEIERDILGSRRPGQEIHLALALPRTLMRFPWELMCLPSSESGTRELIAERFAFGRQMWSNTGRRSRTTILSDGKIRALIVGDPVRAGQVPLEGARREARYVASICRHVQLELGREFDFDPERDVFIGESLTCAGLRRLLRDGAYDIVHFAGHGMNEAGDPTRSGWMLSDGLLSTMELKNTLAWCPAPPWLVYANACHSGMSGEGDPRAYYHGEVYGLAEACIREGVGAFIAPLWTVSDVSAHLFASEFYDALLLDRATLGVSVRKARMRTRRICEDKRGRFGEGDISWAAMVLYGNPTERLGTSVIGG